MRRMLSIICALILTAMLPGAYLLGRQLPPDTNRYVSQKYAGWNGVLQAWICCEWECGGSFVTWLNRCAAQFEKNHPGVFIEFTPVSRDAMRTLGANGIRPPQMLLFSPGVVIDPSMLAQLGFPDALRHELRRDQRALPVAMDGVIWAVNPEATGAAAAPENAAGMLGLLGSTSDAPVEMIEPGIDLGLPAFAGEEIALRADALDLFINGEAGRIAVNASQLRRLMQLRESGRGPDWTLQGGGSFAAADRLLMIAAVNGAEEPLALCREFAHVLLEEESQAALTAIGAYPVTGRAIYPLHDARSTVDLRIASLPLAAGEPFSEHSPENAEAIVRSAAQGGIHPADAAAQLGLSLSLPNHPN